MKYQGCLLAVKDIEVSKDFYQNYLHQTIVMDIGAHVAFEGFSLQEGYAELLGMPNDSIQEQAHNFQLYFEVDDLESVCAELEKVSNMEWLHKIKEYPWGQRDVRVYDPDRNIVEIAEDIGVVIQRFLKQGMSVSATAQRTMLPVAFVKQYAAITAQDQLTKGGRSQ